MNDRAGPFAKAASGDEFAALVLESAGEAGVALTGKQALLLSRHIQIMLRWNSRLNLTRITDREEIIIKHILDSIVPAKFLPSSGHALDVGTGAGFPGIPLKIVHPGLRMVLLESSRKKVSFLTAAAAALGIEGISALHGRWQEFSAGGHAEKFQLVTMRALRLETEEIHRLASLVLAPGGVLACWKAAEAKPPAGGPEGGEDFRTGRKNYGDVQLEGDISYSLPGIKQRRAIRLWRKEKRMNRMQPGV